MMPNSRLNLELGWTKLRHMQSLEVLHVSQLLAPEASGLAKLVRSLTTLERLHVGVAPYEEEADALLSYLKSFFLPNRIEAAGRPQSPELSPKNFPLQPYVGFSTSICCACRDISSG